MEEYYEGYLLDTYSYMLSDADNKALAVTHFLVDNKYSIRKVAKEFCLSKSTVHRMVESTRTLSFELYKCAKRQLKKNKEVYFHA